MLLQATYGNESFRDPAKTYDLRCLYEYPANMASVPAQQIAFAAKDQRSGVRAVGTEERLPASPRSASHGNWSIGRFNVPENALIRIEMQRRAATFGFDYKKLYIRMREDAALRQIRVIFTGHQEASMPCGYFEGRFDIVPPDRFEELGLVPLRSEQFTLDDADDWYTVGINEPEVAAWRLPAERVTIPTASGRTVSVPKVSTGRKLTLRKR